MGPSSLCRFCPGCIIVTRGHDFREGQGKKSCSLAGDWRTCAAGAVVHMSPQDHHALYDSQRRDPKKAAELWRGAAQEVTKSLDVRRDRRETPSQGHHAAAVRGNKDRWNSHTAVPERPDQLSPPHSITSSARASTDGGQLEAESTGGLMVSGTVLRQTDRYCRIEMASRDMANRIGHGQNGEAEPSMLATGVRRSASASVTSKHPTGPSSLFRINPAAANSIG
jgi:hypothetical protein